MWIIELLQILLIFVTTCLSLFVLGPFTFVLSLDIFTSHACKTWKVAYVDSINLLPKCPNMSASAWWKILNLKVTTPTQRMMKCLVKLKLRMKVKHYKEKFYCLKKKKMVTTAFALLVLLKVPVWKLDKFMGPLQL